MKARKNKAPDQGQPNNSLKVPGDSKERFRNTARNMLKPDFRHGHAAQTLLHAQLKDSGFEPGLGDYADAVTEILDKAAQGDLLFASRMLAAQAVTLDNIFAETTRRMALNMGEHLSATEAYARMAMKAQAGSRATLEALAKLHSPREQTVRHVHVNEGGQAVIADQFHHHTGGQENGQAIEQPHATRTVPAGPSAALPGPNPLGETVPVPGGEGQGALQDARRGQGKWGT